jgi:hypothetical protein
MTTLRTLVLGILVASAVGACGSAASASTVPPEAISSAAAPTPSDGGGTSPGDPGATPDPNSPVATDVPVGPGGGSPFDPNSGRIVIPKPGQLGVHPVPAQSFTAIANGRRVVVTVAYTSGVEPCNVLDSIIVRTGALSFEITLREGHGPEDVACIDIAESKRAIVDLGELEPGTYTISDGTGVAAPINVTVA